jgi:hypothetical protein
VAFSTGDQNDISADGRMYNVWSLTEIPSGTKAVSRVNWYLNKLNAKGASATEDRFVASERVFGPMSLFNSKLYFTTYDPNTADKATCKAGISYLWGVHFVNRGSNVLLGTTNNPADGPFPELKVDPNDGDEKRVRYAAQDAGSIAFGVGISQQPACISWTANVAVDSALAYGTTHSAMNTITPGPFQLVVQSGKTVGGSDVKATTYNLAQPPGGSVIDSWAAIVE